MSRARLLLILVVMPDPSFDAPVVAAKTQESLAETTSKGPVHAYLTDTGAEHTHEDGSRNRAVAPARKHMVQYFATPQTNDPLVAPPAEGRRQAGCRAFHGSARRLTQLKAPRPQAMHSRQL